MGHYQLNSPKHEPSAQHQLCALQGKRRMDIDCRWLQGATMWIQSPEYDSITSGVSSCQSHLGGLSAQGHAARGQSTQQRTSRDSPMPIMLLLFPNSWGQQGRVWAHFTHTESVGLLMQGCTWSLPSTVRKHWASSSSTKT